MSTVIGTQIQSGVASIGSSKTNLATVSVDFPQPFGAPPVVTANTLQGTNYPGQISDTFAVSVTQVSATGFIVNVFRVDNIPNGSGWSQNLRLGWTANAV